VWFGAAASAALALAFGALVATYDEPSGDGPTAAALGQALNIVLGVELGLFAGSAITAAIARVQNVLCGLVAGGLAYLAVLTPLFVLTSPEGVSAADAFGVAVFLFIPTAFVLFAGSMVGRLFARIRRA
jgi:hypothetical protein